MSENNTIPTLMIKNEPGIGLNALSWITNGGKKRLLGALVAIWAREPSRTDEEREAARWFLSGMSEAKP